MAREKDIYEYRSYKAFLKSKVGPEGSRTGVKGAMARALRCQPTYVSQVLKGDAQFSLEQGEILAEHFGLTHEERHFFLLLIQKDRAGTKRLEKYFEEQVAEILTKRMVLTSRLGQGHALKKEDQSIYYSSWHYAAVHMAITVPEYRSVQAIAAKLGLTLKRTNEVLEFLERAGLAAKGDKGYQVGTAQIRLGKDSHNIIKHHTNWRNRAIESLDQEVITDLHYTAVVTLSREDVLRLKDMMLKFMKDCVELISPSNEEVLYAYNLDLFEVGQREMLIG